MTSYAVLGNGRGVQHAQQGLRGTWEVPGQARWGWAARPEARLGCAVEAINRAGLKNLQCKGLGNSRDEIRRRLGHSAPAWGQAENLKHEVCGRSRRVV